MLRRLARSEAGFGLVELLIAMVVLSIGITAIVAGYSSAILAVNRAKSTTTAGTIADQKMEMYRQGAWAAVPTNGPQPPTITNGYWMQVTGTPWCVFPPPAGSPPPCPITPVVSRAVTGVTIEVRDGSASGKLLFTETA